MADASRHFVPMPGSGPQHQLKHLGELNGRHRNCPKTNSFAPVQSPLQEKKKKIFQNQTKLV